MADECREQVRRDSGVEKVIQYSAGGRGFGLQTRLGRVLVVWCASGSKFEFFPWYLQATMAL